jgi:hypothetical protein
MKPPRPRIRCHASEPVDNPRPDASCLPTDP